jgi:chromosome segregation ATPase
LNTVNAKLEMANTRIQSTSGIKENAGKQLANYHDQISRLQGQVESLTENLQEVTDQFGKAMVTKSAADNQMAQDRGIIDQLRLQIKNITAQHEAALPSKGATERINVLQAQIKADEAALALAEEYKKRLVATLKTNVDSNRELQTKLKIAETSLEDIKQLLVITNKTKGINSKQLGEFDALRMQVKVLTDKLASVTKMKQAHIKQLADEDPMYIDAVHKRERQRLGGR